MNEKQFEIVKSFQKMGADYRKLAKAFKESEAKIARAYNAENYTVFKKSKDEDPMQQFKDMFGI